MDSFDDFTRGEMTRYARHFSLSDVGPDGQRRIRRSRVLVVGAGGLGSPTALYLAAAGVGTLGIVDDDRVELSNLQRQILHGTSDVGRLKVESAGERIAEMNPHVDLRLHRTRLTSANAEELLSDYDLVVDGSDNFPTRYLVNDASVLQGKPWVYGAVLRWEGQVGVFGAPDGPCYRCIFREPPPPGMVPGCAEAGVMGMLTGVIGSMQALEAVKWILGAGESAVGRLLRFDGLALTMREIRPRKDPACPLCGEEPTIRELIDYEWFCETGATRAVGAVPEASDTATPDPSEPADTDLDPEALRRRMDASDPPVLIDVREDWEWAGASLASLGAMHLPLGELADRLDEIPADREVIVYCQSGIRSARAVERLKQAGRERVRHLAGGLDAWLKSTGEPWNGTEDDPGS